MQRVAAAVSDPVSAMTRLCHADRMTLIAEDLLLLLLDDDSGTVPALWVDIEVPLGAAVLSQLALDGDVEVRDGGTWWAPGGPWPSPEVSATEGATEQDPVLRDALAMLREHPGTAQELVYRVGGGLQERLADRLVEAGVLERHEDRVLGLFPRTRWPAARTVEEAAVRDSVRACLLDDSAPDGRIAALIGLLQALDRVTTTLGLHGADAQHARERALAIAQDDWASATVRDAIASAASAAMLGPGGSGMLTTP